MSYCLPSRRTRECRDRLFHNSIPSSHKLVIDTMPWITAFQKNVNVRNIFFTVSSTVSLNPAPVCSWPTVFTLWPLSNNFDKVTKVSRQVASGRVGSRRVDTRPHKGDCEQQIFQCDHDTINSTTRQQWNDVVLFTVLLDGADSGEEFVTFP